MVISWGDGSADTTLSLDAGVLTFSTDHQYLDNGTALGISVNVTDKDNASDVGGVVITIDNVAQPGANIDPLTGKATIILTNLIVGMHTFSASYAGDADFTGSNSGAAQIQTVNRAWLAL